MAASEWISWPSVNLSLLLVTVEVIGDRFQAETLAAGLDKRWNAILDTTFVHGGVAGISWLIVISGGKTYTSGGAIFDTLLSVAVGILVDVDHFIAARSLHIQNAMHMVRRPAFHSTSLLLVTVIMLALLSFATTNRFFDLRKLAIILLVAGLSHHLRDGIRHGLWFPPFGSTAPLPYWLYLAASVALPHCCAPLFTAVPGPHIHSMNDDVV